VTGEDKYIDNAMEENELMSERDKGQVRQCFFCVQQVPMQ